MCEVEIMALQKLHSDIHAEKARPYRFAIGVSIHCRSFPKTITHSMHSMHKGYMLFSVVTLRSHCFDVWLLLHRDFTWTLWTISSNKWNMSRIWLCFAHNFASDVPELFEAQNQSLRQKMENSDVTLTKLQEAQWDERSLWPVYVFRVETDFVLLAARVFLLRRNMNLKKWLARRNLRRLQNMNI